MSLINCECGTKKKEGKSAHPMGVGETIGDASRTLVKHLIVIVT